MVPAYANAACCRPRRPPKPTECVEKRSWHGDEQVCFPRIGSMIVGCWSSRHPMSTLLRRTLTNLRKHANHAEGVQYATQSFCSGCCGGQTLGSMPRQSKKR